MVRGGATSAKDGEDETDTHHLHNNYDHVCRWICGLNVGRRAGEDSILTYQSYLALSPQR